MTLGVNGGAVGMALRDQSIRTVVEMAGSPGH